MKAFASASRRVAGQGERGTLSRKTGLLVLGTLAALVPVRGEAGLGLVETMVSDTPRMERSVPLVADGRAAPLWVDAADFAGVHIAVSNLQQDVDRVTGIRPAVSMDARGASSSAASAVLVGTLGRSAEIDHLVASGKLDDRDLRGRRESFVITTLDQPFPGLEQALVIAGSDRRGTIYGVYELSEQLGVSPWYWWADVPPKKRSAAFVLPGRYSSGEPVVEYRGIFINDEEPCLGPWAREKFGGINAKMYVHMFELILRLRGNYLWPAMWGKSIYEDDPESARLADAYGVVLGTSHHEPMTRAHSDWSRNKDTYGNGEWNYATNEEGLTRFWTEGIRRNKDYETLITVGMRGDGDEPMIRGGDMAANSGLLERIIADQRGIIAREMKADPAEIPQMWALYKEVKDYYDGGMAVPGDITLLWCDDNWGNLRRLPTPEERKRPGGAGIYYHFDYVGSPRCYKWLNTNPLPKVWEQMNMAHAYGANRIWVVNVGDLKPMEMPIEFFLRMAWDPSDLPKEAIAGFTRAWAAREFGPEHAGEIADIVSKYAKYNGWRKPELLEPNTFSLVHHQEAERVEAAWRAITADAERINDKLAPEYLDAFYQLVLYPTKASATVAEMYIAAGRNRLYAAQGRASANDQALRVRTLFQQDQQLSDTYHRLADGKWNHMMAQTRIGYTGWGDPKENVMPEVVELEAEPMASMGVAIEGSEGAWPAVGKKANVLIVELEHLAGQGGFAPFAVMDDAGAFGGKAVGWPATGEHRVLAEPSDSVSGRMAIPFTLSESASVQVDIRADMGNPDDDSFYYQLDAGDWVIMNDKRTEGFQVINVASFSDLAAGEHVLNILRREDGARFDHVVLTASTGTFAGASVAEDPASPVLPPFDSLNPQQRWIEVFRRGSKAFPFTVTASRPWVTLSAAEGTTEQDQRILVSVDWDRTLAGEQDAEVTVSGPGGERVTIRLHAVCSRRFTPHNVDAFGGLTGPTSIAAEDARRNITADGARWERIPDYGRGASGMAVFPVTAKSVTPPDDAPRLEYPVFIAEAGEVRVDLVTGIALNTQPGRGVRIAVSLDDEAPQILDAFEGQSFDDPSKRGDTSAPAIRNWHTWVKDNARTLTSTHHASGPGVHTLKVWMVDPGVVLEKLVVRRAPLPRSYFGPS